MKCQAIKEDSKLKRIGCRDRFASLATTVLMRFGLEDAPNLSLRGVALKA
jgi:hypothetical protein